MFTAFSIYNKEMGVAANNSTENSPITKTNVTNVWSTNALTPLAISN